MVGKSKRVYLLAVEGEETTRKLHELIRETKGELERMREVGGGKGRSEMLFEKFSEEESHRMESTKSEKE